MLTSSALVLMMTGPGLALFYGGLVRKKNVLATMMQSFILMSIVTVMWRSAATAFFGEEIVLSGGLNHLFLHGVSLLRNAAYSTTIPEQTFRSIN